MSSVKSLIRSCKPKINSRFSVGLFIVEILLKMFALESTFWYDGWNIFDLFVISALWLSTNTLFFGANTKQAGGSLGAARVLRFIKVLRSMKSIKTLKVSQVELFEATQQF